MGVYGAPSTPSPEGAGVSHKMVSVTKWEKERKRKRRKVVGHLILSSIERRVIIWASYAVNVLHHLGKMYYIFMRGSFKRAWLTPVLWKPHERQKNNQLIKWRNVLWFQASSMLQDKYEIHHATIQVEDFAKEAMTNCSRFPAKDVPVDWIDLKKNFESRRKQGRIRGISRS